MPFRSLHDNLSQPLGGPIHAGNVAVITGAASGIGLAAARHFAQQGLKLALCDVDPKLETVAKELEAVAGEGNVVFMRVDVSKVEELTSFREKVLDTFGEISVLMNNAAVFEGGGTFAKNLDKWRTMIEVNLFGVINGVQVFAPYMVEAENASFIINTGSKQGITCPPGNAAYNVSKSAVKTLTEQLAHELREAQSKCSAHLFVPGWTHTGAGGNADGPKPDGAWTAEQTVLYMLARLERGDFYIVCPDNDVTEEMDRLRMSWSATDVVANRPALSRWHPDWKNKFADYMKDGQAEAGDKTARSRSRGRADFLTPKALQGDDEFGGAGVEIRDGGRRTPAE